MQVLREGANAGHAVATPPAAGFDSNTLQVEGQYRRRMVTWNTARTLRYVAAVLMLGGAVSGCRRGRPGANSPRASYVVHIRDFRFQPTQLTVRVGDLVTWVNNDNFQHTVSGDDMAFGSGELRRGERHVWVPETPGRYAYHCFAHPTMRATVTVVERPLR